MFKITVTKNANGQIATAKADRVQILIDHLTASAGRNGFVVQYISDDAGDLGVKGYLQRNGKDVALWEITAA